MATNHDAIRRTYRESHGLLPPAKTEADATTQASDEPSIPDDAIDLKAWARGDENYSFDELMKGINDLVEAKLHALADRVGSIEGPQDVLDYLVEEGVVDGDDVRGDL